MAAIAAPIALIAWLVATDAPVDPVTAPEATGEAEPAPGGPAGTEEASEPVAQFQHLHGLEAPAWGDGDVYVSTHQGAFRIDPSGDWSWVSDVPHDYMGFAANPSEEGVFYSSGHPAPGSDLPNPLGFMVSADHAATWQPRSLSGEVDFHAMAVHILDGEVIYAYDGRDGLLRSVDAGREWTRLTTAALRSAGGVLSLAVGSGDGDEVLAGTEAGLLRSIDAGASWDTLLDAPVSAVAIDASDPQRIMAYATADDQGLVVSTDGGSTWGQAGLVLEEDAVAHLAISPDDPATVWAGTWNASLWRTTDGGQEWKRVAEEGRSTAR